MSKLRQKLLFTLLHVEKNKGCDIIKTTNRN